EELEKAGAFENLKVMPEKPKRREPEIIKDKNVYHVNGFSCANCAGKFENNVKKLSNVHDAKVNFGASKISVYGEASIEELEKAGAFENLEVIPEKPTRTPVAEDEPKEDKIPFYKKHSTLLYSALFMALGFLSMAVNGNENIVTAALFITSMIVGGTTLMKTGLQNLVRCELDMRTLMTSPVLGGALLGEWAAELVGV